MTKPEHTQNTRPFNLEHARAGAPYCCSDGQEATVLKWDCRNTDYPLLGAYGDDDSPVTWTANGRYYGHSVDHEKDLVMTRLGFIDGKPVFVGDEVLLIDGQPFTAVPKSRDFKHCTWPSPARQYPVTGMTARELQEVVDLGNIHHTEWREAIANAALRHAIDADTVRITEEVVAAQAVRDIKIAQAAVEYMYNKLYTMPRTAFCDLKLDLQSIVDSVEK